jgi:methylmalonyl-CoA epimerase
MAITKIGHLALVVPDLDAALDHFRRILDWKDPDAIVARDDDSHTALVPIGDAYLELIQPLSEGPLMSFLEKTGGGFHHVGLTSDDLRADWERQSQQRDEIGVLDSVPRVDDYGVSLWFLHPKRNLGVLWSVDANWVKTSASDLTPVEPTPDWEGASDG